MPDPDAASSSTPATNSAEAAISPISRKRWRLVGPGLVAAATGVGSGDLVAALLAGSQFGYTLLWAIVLGTIIKIAMAEGVGRWHLASGSTMFAGWRSLGPWTTAYFAPYILIWGFVYGATAMSTSALPLAALWPAVPLPVFAIASGVLGLVLVGFGGYGLLEKLVTVLVGMMFVIVVGLAIITLPNFGELITGIVPVLPDGSVFYTLGLLGGVGGTITIAAYGYWVNAKGWRTIGWLKVMRLDNRVAYLTTGIFVVAMLVVGTELLYSAGIALGEDGSRGLLELDDVLQQRYGSTISVLFLLGFWAAAFSSLLGVWNGVSLMFADFVANLRGRVDNEMADKQRSPAFWFYLLWLTVPPIALVFLGRPFAVVIAYGVVGAAFLPFLALTLLWLLNSRRVPSSARNGWLSNTMLALSAVIFLVLAISKIIDLLG